MTAPPDLSQLPPQVQKILDPAAPAKLREMAAKGVVPGLRSDAILTVVVLLAEGGDPQLGAVARATLAQLPDQLLKGALGADLDPVVLRALADHYHDRMDVLEKLVRMPRLPVEAVEILAQRGSEAAIELIATNEERMLAHPTLIELVYMNKKSRMSTANRLVELAVRHGIELHGIPAWKEIAQAIQGELIVEASAEPLPEDQLFWEQDQLAEELADETLEDAFYEDEEGAEHLEDKLKPLFVRLAEMTLSEKIRRAMLGTKEERMMLLREPNKIVSAAAARSPMLQEPEVVQITRNRGVNDGVLRIIGSSPEWLKSYQIKKNLVENSKTPISIAQKLVTQLREADLRKIARSKNVSSAVQTAARRHLERRNQ
jgi:hypothetical protein